MSARAGIWQAMRGPSFLLVGLIFAEAAYATDRSVESQVQLQKSAPAGLDELTMFAGASAGYTQIHGSDVDGTGQGRNNSAFGLLSPRRGSWRYDLGLGWQQTRLKGRSEKGEVFDMITQSAAIDFNPSYVFGHGWQIGPLASLLTGTDLRYGLDSESSSQILMWGARLSYEWLAVGSWRMRAFAQVAVESTLLERQVRSGTLGLMIGLPLGSKDRGTVATTASVSPAESKQDVRISLNPEMVFFRTASAGVKPEVQELLRMVAVQVEQQHISVDSIDVIGHADQRGSASYNLKLSQRRAQSIRDYLESSGVERAKIHVQALGYQQLRDRANTPKAWAVNRRVELIFRGVSEPEKLRALLQRLDHFSPEFGH